MRDLAAKELDGTVALARRGLARESDDEMITRLIEVRGIGRWTAEMFLMFQLRRLDVWPVGDFGVRRGYGMAWQGPGAESGGSSSPRRAGPALPVGHGLVLLAGRGTVRGRGGQRADSVAAVGPVRRGHDGGMQKFSLEATARELLERARGGRGGRAATTVVGGHEKVLRQTVIAMVSGACLAEHENPGEASVHVLSGRVRLSAGQHSWDAPAR